jgi:hypothetical protein
MSAADYRFVTPWRVRGLRETVYRTLLDGVHYPRWWKPAYISCRELAPKKIEMVVRGKLPYTLTFTTEVIRENPFEEFEVRATGELDGTGLWTLRQDGAFTELVFYWNVRVTKPLVRHFSYFLKPLLVWNHNWVMSTGEKALQEEIFRRRKTS